eukprot:scaffold11425_cov102-Isochrysis_galbana.AAC.3
MNRSPWHVPAGGCWITAAAGVCEYEWLLFLDTHRSRRRRHRNRENGLPHGRVTGTPARSWSWVAPLVERAADAARAFARAMCDGRLCSESAWLSAFGEVGPLIDKSPNWEVRAYTGKMETSASQSAETHPGSELELA